MRISNDRGLRCLNKAKSAKGTMMINGQNKTQISLSYIASADTVYADWTERNQKQDCD